MVVKARKHILGNIILVSKEVNSSCSLLKPGATIFTSCSEKTKETIEKIIIESKDQRSAALVDVYSLPSKFIKIRFRLSVLDSPEALKEELSGLGFKDGSYIITNEDQDCYRPSLKWQFMPELIIPASYESLLQNDYFKNKSSKY